ncbi:MAG: hypothetical protein HS105_09895 [Chloracidobacterium sp.]|nr:hypothetical protein [Chloracidobacterium sp.]MCC6826081.1 hypothetical protein [Acidobacteriota bacterium]MCO5333762.1 hypothetical protein [Pyrinomonadaceae bacterium]
MRSFGVTRWFLPALLLLGGMIVSANAQSAANDVGPVRSSAAYSVVLLRKTELEADIVSYADDYTEDNPKVIDARFELAAINRDIDRMLVIKPSDIAKLTESTGRLILRKAEIDTELNRLQRSYKSDHPQVKRLAKKADIYSKAVSQILGK